MAPRSGDGVGEAADQTRSRRKPGTTLRARKLRQTGNQAEDIAVSDRRFVFTPRSLDSVFSKTGLSS
ncbi:MAG: hypothetical protein E5X74_15410 [Mesorhizobium sp.]|nr:MAG: hypothetical protein E5X75_20470 [Mesorhizobium sp.]TIO84604.1 MAG: hypothetical protein E5X74_15410 [Mesorhizobium sp.]